MLCCPVLAFWSFYLRLRWLHVILGLPLTTVGWVLGPLAVAQRRSAHANNLHQICGIVVFPVLLLQILSGIFISGRRVKDGKAHPPSNVVHVVAGMVILGLSVVEGITGARNDRALSPTAKTTVLTVCAVWVAIWGTSYLVGLILLPRQFAQERLGWGLSSNLTDHYTMGYRRSEDGVNVARHGTQTASLEEEQEATLPIDLSATEMREVQTVIPVSVRSCYPQE